MPRLAWLVGALLVATALRLPELGQQSLWVDEGSTYIRATLPFGEALSNLLEVRTQAPLYYLLMRPWVELVGESEFALRLPSAFSGILNVALVYLVGRRSGRIRLGVWAAWTMAVNPFHVWYSRDARTYALTLALVTLTMWWFVRVVHKGDRWRWAALGVMSSLAYLSHYATLAIGLVQFLVFLLTFRRTYRLFRKWYVVQAASALPVVGWVTVSMVSYGPSGLRCPWIPTPSLLAPLGSLWNFSLGYDGQLGFWTSVGLLPFAVALAASAWSKTRRMWWKSVLLWLILPPSMALLLSIVSGPSYVDRYLSICLPGYLLLISAGLLRLPWPKLRGALGVVLVIAMTISALGILSGERFPKADWRGAVGYVLEGARDGERLLIDSRALYVAFYYVGYALPLERVDLHATEAGLDKAFQQEGRAWFLYRDPFESVHVLDRVKQFDPYASGEPHITRWLEEHHEQIKQEWYLNGVYLALLE